MRHSNYGRNHSRGRRNQTERFTIEPGGRGATYHHTEGFTLYKLDWYPRGSVLEGQQRRTFVDRYKTL